MKPLYQGHVFCPSWTRESLRVLTPPPATYSTLHYPPSPQGYDLFCVNGLTFPDRSPHPALWEAKFLAQPVGMDLASHPGDSAVVKLLLTNRYDFLSLDHLSVSWRLLSAAAPAATSSPGSPLSEGSVTIEGVPPGGSREVEIERLTSTIVGAGRRGETFLHVEFRLSAETPWAPEGHLVAWGSFPVGETTPPGDAAAGDETSPLRFSTQEGDSRSGTPGAPRVAGEAAGEETARLPLPSLIVYEDEKDGSVSSREGSPMGQL